MSSWTLQSLAPGAGALSLWLEFPDEYKINPLIDSKIEVRSEDGLVATAVVADARFSLPVEFTIGEGHALC